MAASYIDGKVVASQIKARVKTDIEHWVSKDNRLPSLQVILVGNNPASQSYVKSKTTDCEEVGIDSDTLFLPDTISEKELC